MRTIPGFALTCFLTVTAACGCAPIDPKPITEPPEKPAPIHSLVILPATPQPEQNGGEDNMGQLREGAEVLDQLYAEIFEGAEAVNLLPEERLEALSSDITGSRLERARLVGKKLGSDGVLLTIVERFFERDGTEYAVDSPASVAFRFQLIHVESGRVACVGQYTETQQPLTENIFAFPRAAGRGFRWLTARELAREGLRRELDECGQLQPLRPAGP